jgi:hypothetical protein
MDVQNMSVPALRIAVLAGCEDALDELLRRKDKDTETAINEVTYAIRECIALFPNGLVK